MHTAVHLQYIAGEGGESSNACDPLQWRTRKKQGQEGSQSRAQRESMCKSAPSKRTKKQKVAQRRKQGRAENKMEKGGSVRAATLEAKAKTKLTEIDLQGLQKGTEIATESSHEIRVSEISLTHQQLSKAALDQLHRKH